MEGYEFKLLTQDHKDERLSNTLLAQEHDLWEHMMNKARYELILADSEFTDTGLRERYDRLLHDTNSRIIEVSAIIKAINSAISDHEPLRAAQVRLAEKRMMMGRQ